MIRRTVFRAASLLGFIGILMTASPPASAAPPIVVTTLADTEDPNDGYVSLREAINEANLSPDKTDIHFDIDNAVFGPPPHVILVGSGNPAGFPLPHVVYRVVIDGSSEWDYAGAPVVVLDGSNVVFFIEDLGSTYQNGLHLGADAYGSVIRGLEIQNFPGRGINVYSGNNIIEGNVIDGNGGDGGIIISNENLNLIGNNVISGNNTVGILVSGFADNGHNHGHMNRIQDNVIVGNNGDGVRISGAENEVLDNVISDNTGHGIMIAGGEWVKETRVQGNFIGTDENGAQLGNGQHGVVINASDNLIGGFDFRRGSDRNFAANTIAFNGEDGVRVGSGTGNAIRGNSIFDNAELGIDLGLDGVTANDFGDPDSGANTLQNFPILKTAHTLGGTTTIRMRFNSTPSTTFHIDLYVNDHADPSGHGEGRTYLHTVDVTTAALPSTEFIVVSVPAVAPGKYITATATDPDRNTSEFSNAVEVVLGRALSQVGREP